MTLTLHTEQHRQRALQIIQGLSLETPMEITVKPHKSRRSLEQNAKMWAMLSDVSRQVEWYGHWLTAQEWKDVFTAALKRLKIVPGIDGGFVSVGGSTSKMKVSEMGDMIELMYAFGSERGVRWSDPSDIINHAVNE